MSSDPQTSETKSQTDSNPISSEIKVSKETPNDFIPRPEELATKNETPRDQSGFNTEERSTRNTEAHFVN